MVTTSLLRQILIWKVSSLNNEAPPCEYALWTSLFDRVYVINLMGHDALGKKCKLAAAM